LQARLSVNHAEVADRMRAIALATQAMAERIELLFVTNLNDGDMRQTDGAGLSNVAQYYSRRQADDIIRSLQDIGVTVVPFFDELSFLRAVTAEPAASSRLRVVFTTAEGGTGSGRRALVPSVCNLLGLPVLNSKAHAQTLSRHKFHVHAVLRRVGVRVPGTWKFDGRWAAGQAPSVGTKIIIKPMYESQSIGIGDDSVRVADANLDAVLRDKLGRFGQPVVVQEFVSGDEVGVPLARIGDTTYSLPPMAYRQSDGTLFGDRPKTFDDENLKHNVRHEPFAASGPLAAALDEAAVLAFDALEMSGAARIDFRIDADGRPWVFDTSESPPPTAGSSYTSSMAHLGFEVSEMLAVWLGICLHEQGLLSGV
jgi:D-alanine-D-alanine ligase